MMHKFAFSLLAAAISTMVGTQAHAWGREGHMIVAEVAKPLLTQKARVQVQVLLDGQDMAEASTYLDEERMRLKASIPGSEGWHYDNTPVCGSPTTSSCKKGMCASAVLPEFIAKLGDRSATKQDRAFALRAVLHLVGDIHQPLHAADNNDRGGNQVRVGKSGNLHSLWDSGLLKRSMRHYSEQSYAQMLSTREGALISSSQSGNVSAWMNESSRLAKTVAYGYTGFACGVAGSIDRLAEDYVERALPVIDQQLAKGGARLAYVLNEALGK